MATNRRSPDPILPKIPFAICPIRASLGILGRRWAMLLMRDIAALKLTRFSEMLHNNPGLTPRALSMRLRDLQNEGLIEKVVNPKDDREIRYRLTRKGQDVLPILAAFIQFGIKHYAERVFDDGKPRDLQEIFPGRQKELLGSLISYSRKQSGLRGA